MRQRMTGARVSLPPQDDMRGLLGRDEFHTLVSERPQVESLEQRFTSAEQDRRNGDVQFIDEARAKILPNGVRPAADAHVHGASGLACTLERLVNAAGDEVKGRAAFHLDGGTGMVGQDEDRHVIGRVVAPPAFPVCVRPGSAQGAEHVPPENPGPAVLEAARGEVIVNAGGAAIPAVQGFLKGAGRNQPLVQIFPANAERISEILTRTRAVSVQRDGEAADANSCHAVLSFGCVTRESSVADGCSSGQTSMTP